MGEEILMETNPKYYREISRGNVRSIAEKMKKTTGMLYQHLKELRELGYVNEKFEITMAGRLALL